MISPTTTIDPCLRSSGNPVASLATSLYVANAQPYAIKMPIACDWIPQEDITAYELAKLLPFYLGHKPMYERDWQELGTMQRHFTRKDG